MIIRHAEKPEDHGPVHGVDPAGHHDRHALTVRGWQRAGALVTYFAPSWGLPDAAPISTPRTIIASAATPHSPSYRAQHTVTPLADRLGIAIDNHLADGEESDVAAAALAAESPVLIAWHHHHISVLAGLIAGDFEICPTYWPDDCYDVVWVLDQGGERWPWQFHQVAQRLLPGDRATTL